MTQSILIIDDDPQLLTLTSLILSRAGYTTHQANNAEEALDMIERDMPDLFVIDVMMPQMDGFELCRLLRERPDTAHLPIVMFTAMGDMGSIEQGYLSGANLYLTKPMQARDLVARIEEVLTAFG